MEVCSGEDGEVILNFAYSDGTVIRSILNQFLGERLTEDPEYDDEVLWAAYLAGRCVRREFSIGGVDVEEVEFLRDVVGDYAERMEWATKAVHDLLKPEHEPMYHRNIYLATETAQAYWARRLATQLTGGLEMLAQVTPDYVPDDFPDV